MDPHRLASLSTQHRSTSNDPRGSNSQTAVALFTDNNMILRNRYTKLRRTKINHFTVSKVQFKPKSQSAMYEKPAATSQQFISNFIRSQKVKFTSKLCQAFETSQEVLFYVRTKNEEKPPLLDLPKDPRREFRSPAEMRASHTDKNLVSMSESPNHSVKQLDSHTRQASQPNPNLQQQESPRKIRFESVVQAPKLRKSHRVVAAKSIRSTLQNQNQAQVQMQNPDEDKKNRPLLLHDSKGLAHIKSQSYAVLEYPSGQIILAYRAKQSLEIASLTKIMTCYLVLKVAEEKGKDLSQETFQVREYVECSTGTTAELIHGDIYTIQQLLYALMLPSGNDAALSLADWAGGVINSSPDDHKQNIKVFVKQMNTRAKALGLNDTRYGNPHGLPHKDTRSTACDTAKLATICLAMPIFRKIVSTKEFKCLIKSNDGESRPVMWENTNKLLRRVGFLGIKTGITVTAGPCLASAYQFKDKTYVAVLLRANKVSRRFTQTRKILYWTLKSLWKNDLTQAQSKQLEDLRRNKRQFDSDNSQDEQQFQYGGQGGEEYARRKKILKYEL